MPEPSLKTARRYYLGKRREAAALDQYAVSDVWGAKQEAEPGTVLPSGFPVASKLALLNYTTVQDIDGANEEELRCAGLTSREATAVIAALQPLLP